MEPKINECKEIFKALSLKLNELENVSVDISEKIHSKNTEILEKTRLLESKQYEFNNNKACKDWYLWSNWLW